MAAPSATNRGTPAGIPLKTGHPTKITFEADPTVEFWEFSTKPSGVTNGDPVNLTSAHNIRRRTKVGRPLIEHTNGTTSVFYDPEALTSAMALCGVNTTITETFPDSSQHAYWGHMLSFEPDDLNETNTDAPSATVEFVNGSYDDANNTEEAPVMTLATGT